MWIELILFYRFVYHGWESTMSKMRGEKQLEKYDKIYFLSCVRSNSISTLLITLSSFNFNYEHL